MTQLKVIDELNKRFGVGFINILGDAQYPKIERISTGSLFLDLALGGGVPRGRIVEIFGPESSGKTTLALHIIAEAQKLGGRAAFVDMEHALDIDYAGKLGVQVSELAFTQPDNGEQALEAVEALVRSGEFAAIVVDSVAALVPKRELEGDMGDASMALQARLMSQALRKLSGAISKTNTVVIFINQLRMKIVQYGNPETTAGGMALKFYASQRLDIRRMQDIKKAGGVDGIHVKVRVVKNKVAPPKKVAEFDIIFNQGISWESELVDAGTQVGVITRRGAHYYYGEEKIGQGKDQARAYLTEHPDMMKSILDEVKEKSGSVSLAAEENEPGEEVEELF